MARILEPLLWRRFTHLQAESSVLESEDIDLDLAANEGVLILGLDFIIPTQFTASVEDLEAAVVARPSAEDSIDSMPEANADTDFVAGFHFNVAVLTSGITAAPHERDWRAPGNGLVIARRMTYFQDTSDANAIMALTVWYKRLIFTNDEMIGLLIRRR